MMMRRFYRYEQPTLAIVGADNWLGHVIAWDILQHYRKREFVVRLLVRNEKYVKDLRDLGADVHVISYEHDDSIDKALEGVTIAIIVPEVDDRRVDQARKFAESAKNVKLSNIVTLSILGAGDSRERTLCDYRDIEKAIEDTKSRWVTLRPALLSERFFHYECNIKENRALSLNTHADSRWAPLNLKDLIEAVCEICFDQDHLRKEIEQRHAHSVYTLTGPEALTGPLIVDTINYVINQKDAVKFMEVTREQHKEYLESLRKHDYYESFGKREKYKYPMPPPPNDTEIELILDFYDYVTTGKAGYVSGDFTDITDEDPQRLIYFFEENSKSFRPDTRGKRRMLTRHNRLYSRM